MVRPIEEQKKAVEEFRTGRSLRIAAFAGAGKTCTLLPWAKTKRSRSLFLAFNKSIATEASGKFPTTVDCRLTKVDKNGCRVAPSIVVEVLQATRRAVSEAIAWVSPASSMKLRLEHPYFVFQGNAG